MGLRKEKSYSFIRYSLSSSILVSATFLVLRCSGENNPSKASDSVHINIVASKWVWLWKRAFEGSEQGCVMEGHRGMRVFP